MVGITDSRAGRYDRFPSWLDLQIAKLVGITDFRAGRDDRFPCWLDLHISKLCHQPLPGTSVFSRRARVDRDDQPLVVDLEDVLSSDLGTKKNISRKKLIAQRREAAISVQQLVQYKDSAVGLVFIESAVELAMETSRVESVSLFKKKKNRSWSWNDEVQQEAIVIQQLRRCARYGISCDDISLDVITISRKRSADEEKRKRRCDVVLDIQQMD
ncbi:hypothetical protein F511_15580 [Dorcoceras hygrometricum]|uniref:Uncharacterized protein n=1 Tax=Dorcoceras hygrometricum TaxID=472368 RepID=A0A2Z7B3D1_9LAMI|nr:hypothetical protein F511_15580 [Dorcoceras hygrometricum]